MSPTFHLHDKLAAADAPDAASRFGPSGKLARTAVLRAGRPLSVPAEKRAEMLAEAVTDVARDLRIVTLASRPLRGDAVVEAETDIGHLLLHAGDEVMTPLIAAQGTWEAEEAAWLRRVVRPGACVLDVGANIGYFTILMAQLAGAGGAVVAVEPEARNLDVLRANLWRHGLDDVAVVPIAAWSERALLPLVLSEENRGDHQVRPGSAGAAHLVPASDLDGVLGDHASLDVVKVDTQGTDHEAIAGLRRTLGRSPDPLVLVEFWLDGLAERAIDPRAVLAGYRDLGLVPALLGPEGTTTPATDAEVMTATERAPGRFVNLVLRRAAS